MKIYILHATAGHGHKKVAEVIAHSFLKRGIAENQVRVMDALDFTPSVFRKSYPAIYHYSVKKFPQMWGWFYEFLDRPFSARLMRPLRHIFNRLAGRKLLDEIKREKPDLIICAHFFPAELLASAKQKSEILAKLMTVITDFCPHSFWINEGTDCYAVMGDEGAAELQRRGIPKAQIFAGGIPVADDFKPNGRKAEILNRWGFIVLKRFFMMAPVME